MPTSRTKFGEFPIGSPLSYQCSVFEGNFKVISDLNVSNDIQKINLSIDINLLINFIDVKEAIVPKDWENLSSKEVAFFK